MRSDLYLYAHTKVIQTSRNCRGFESGLLMRAVTEEGFICFILTSMLLLLFKEKSERT